MKGFAWVSLAPEGVKGENDYEEVMVDSGSQATIISDKKLDRWIKRGAKIRKIPSKWKNIISYSDTAIEIKDVYLIESLIVRDDFEKIAIVKNITVLVLPNIKFGLCGQNVRAQLEHKNNLILLSLASVGKSKLQSMEFKIHERCNAIFN